MVMVFRLGPLEATGTGFLDDLHFLSLAILLGLVSLPVDGSLRMRYGSTNFLS